MYDKAHERFHKLTISEKNDFYLKLINIYKKSCLKEPNSANTLLTEKVNENLRMKTKRPALIVSK